MLIPYIYHIYIRYIYHIYYVYTILTIWCQWWLHKKMPSSRRWDLAAAVPKEHIPRQRQDLPSELHVAQHVVAPGAPESTGGSRRIPWENHVWNHGNHGTMGISPRSTGKLRLFFWNTGDFNRKKLWTGGSSDLTRDWTEFTSGILGHCWRLGWAGKKYEDVISAPKNWETRSS